MNSGGISCCKNEIMAAGLQAWFYFDEAILTALQTAIEWPFRQAGAGRIDDCISAQCCLIGENDLTFFNANNHGVQDNFDATSS